MDNIVITSPKPFQVFQRTISSERSQQHYNNIGGPNLGSGNVIISGRSPEKKISVVISNISDNSIVHEFSIDIPNNEFAIATLLPAGGWYIGKIRGESADSIESFGPFGVGEIFILAGQSYAGNYSDQRNSICGENNTVSAYDCVADYWRIAHDPLPHPGYMDEGKDLVQKIISDWKRDQLINFPNGGSIWPEVGNMLTSVLRVPIGFANVSFGGSSISMWQPDNQLFQFLLHAALKLGSFRAILWQQGESDVFFETDSNTYADRFHTMAAALEKQVGVSHDWIIAKSTHHPSQYNKPVHESIIRLAIDKIVDDKHFFSGPDCDIFGGTDVRSPPSRSGHLTARGQQYFAWSWFHSLLNHINNLQSQTKPDKVSIQQASDIDIIIEAFHRSIAAARSKKLSADHLHYMVDLFKRYSRPDLSEHLINSWLEAGGDPSEAAT